MGILKIIFLTELRIPSAGKVQKLIPGQFIKPIANLSKEFTANGSFFDLEHLSLTFPEGARDSTYIVDAAYAPIARYTTEIESIDANFLITAKDTLGNLISTFFKPFTITIDFSTSILSNYKAGTFSMYSSEDGVSWNKENTVVDMTTKKATTEVNHMSYFSLMAERIDTTPPITEALLIGEKGEDGWYRSDVNLILLTQDG